MEKTPNYNIQPPNIKPKEKKKAKEKEVKILYFGGQKSGKSRLAEMRALSYLKIELLSHTT